MIHWPPAGVAAVRPLPIRYTPSVIMNRFRRPSLSESRPKNSAPMTSPIRYHQAMSPTWPAPRFSVFFNVKSGPTLLAMVISRPSSIHAMPSAVTSLVWNRDQGSRSILAGIRLRILGLSVVSTADFVVMRDPLDIPRPAFPLLITHPFELCYPGVSGAHLALATPAVLKHAC